MKIKNRKLISPALYDGSCGLRKRDWILFTVLAVLCYVSFAQADLYVTGNRSWLYWTQGGWDFYERSFEFTDGYGANYMPSTFLMFALWVLPLKLLGLPQPESTSWLPYTMWYKLLPTLFYIASAYLIYRICLLIGMKQKKSMICMYAFMTMPVAFYSQFIFSQYDIFTVFFMLLGIYYYFRNHSRKDYLLFCLFFGIAATFKYFALLIFFVLLLLDEKRVPVLLWRAFLALLPLLLEIAVYWHSDAFHKSVFGFGVLTYTTQHDFQTNLGSYSFLKIVVCFLVAWPYFVHPRTRQEKIRWAFYFCCGICFGLFTFMSWHPQWLIFAAPFWVISAFMSKHMEKFLWLDAAFLLVFYALILQVFTNNLDEKVLKGGIWRSLVLEPLSVSHTHMGDFLSFVDSNTMYSAFAVFLLLFFVFKHPRHTLQDFSQNPGAQYMPLIHLRVILTAGIFGILAFFSVLSAYPNLRDFVCAPTVDDWIGVNGNVVYEQPFTGASGTLDSVLVQTATYNRKNTVSIKLQLVDADTGSVLSTATATTDDIKNVKYSTFDMHGVQLEEDGHYILRVFSPNATDDNCYAVGVMEKLDPDELEELDTVSEEDQSVNDKTEMLQRRQMYCSLNGEEQDYLLSFTLHMQ